ACSPETHDRCQGTRTALPSISPRSIRSNAMLRSSNETRSIIETSRPSSASATTSTSSGSLPPVAKNSSASAGRDEKEQLVPPPPPRSDPHRQAGGIEGGGGAPDGMVCGQGSIRERGRFRRLNPFDPDEMPGMGHQEIVGVSSVRAEPDPTGEVAQLLTTSAA